MNYYRYSENTFQHRCSDLLTDAGIEHRREVPCEFGTGDKIFADIVSQGVALECKTEMTTEAIFKGLGQCSAYVASGIAPMAALVIPSSEWMPYPAWYTCHQSGVPILTELSLPGFLRNPVIPPRFCSELVGLAAYITHMIDSQGPIALWPKEQRAALKQVLRPLMRITRCLSADS